MFTDTNDWFLQLLEEEEVDVPVVKESSKDATKMETDEGPTDSASNHASSDINIEDVNVKAENGVAGSTEKPVQMETDAKVCSNL